MTTLFRTPQGKWRVTDIRLGVDEIFDTCTQAQEKVNQCNTKKLKEMSGEECETCGGTGEVSAMEAVYPGEPHMADVGSRRCPDCQDNNDSDA